MNMLAIRAWVVVACCVLPLGQVSSAEPAELFPLSDVRLLDGPFRDAMAVNREVLLAYDPDRLLAPFLTEAGLTPKAAAYPNWESQGLAGHTAGHYLSALANMVASTNDAECKRGLDDMVAELARCQQANGDGYVGGVPTGRRMWAQVRAGDIRATGFSLNDRWVPLYNLHKTLAGLRDAYLVGGNEQAREVLIKLADWCADLVAGLDDRQVQDMLRSEHGGMNEVLADVAAITGEQKYLDLAERFSHRAILDPLASGEDRLNGLHANTQVPKVVGFERIAQLGGDVRGRHAAEVFWDAVVHHRTIAIGGNSISEHFPSPEQSVQWIEHREGPETCNTYNMLRLTEMLFEDQPSAQYADFYERALYNHILSSHHPEHGGYVYFTPVRPRHYRVYSAPEQAFWCCVGSGMENHGKYGRFIYAHTDDALYVNLFIASQLDWKDKQLRVTQQTRFPDAPETLLLFEADRPVGLSLRLRYPSWVAEGRLRVLVNGEPVAVDTKPGSYFTIDRVWNDGDVVSVELPMHFAAEPLPYLDDYVALKYGPIVLAAKTSEDDIDGLVAGDGRMDHIAHGALQPLDRAPMLVAKPDELAGLIGPVDGGPLTFKLPGAVRPDSYDDLELIPFFRLHDARYMLYWRRVTPQQYELVRSEIEAAERAQIALDRATVDRVAPGEQQPETEHNLQGQGDSAGVWRDRRFRHTTDWFSYDLNTRGERDLTLRLTYFGSDRRRFDIRVNGRVIADVELDAPDPDTFIDVDYAIPNDLLAADDDGVVTVRFTAKPGSMAGGVFGVRLIRPIEQDDAR